ncbi:MAG: divalent-cation tolerance protein CutA [Calothrix sp. SM1_5_4]|nr:divalent-cation tolerance protein CutA [Calothrix sp. SM1_5_4]
MSSRKIVLAYCTFPDRETAARICEILVREGTIACANVTTPHLAIYAWQGQVHKEEESAAWLKTTTTKKAALKERIRAIHPYQNPCLIFLDICDGLPDFLKWVYVQSL